MAAAAGPAVYLAWAAGGFFVLEPSLVAVGAAAGLVLLTVLARDPLAGLTRPLAIAAGGLALLAGWTLLSGLWSDAPARALLEYNRTLLYLLVLLLSGLVVRGPGELAWLVRGLALGLVAICGAALLARLLPEVLPTASVAEGDRLTYPVTYWNALGLIAALASLLCFHLASDPREPAVLRLFGAAALPVTATTLLLTFSRGSLVVGLLGLVVYVIAGRPRSLVLGLLAAAPVVLLLRAAYRAELLSGRPLSPPVIEQGQEVALLVLGAVLTATVLRAVGLPLDAKLARLRLPRLPRRPAWAAGVAVVAAVLLAVVLAGTPTTVERQYREFREAQTLSAEGPTRDRLLKAGNNGRLALWGVGLDAWRRAPLLGGGAGTYGFEWLERRTSDLDVIDAHSLYVETLAELGAVGLGLLVLALAVVLWMAARPPGRNRASSAAVLAVLVAWAVHAGIDWDWELPAVTLPIFLLAGGVLTARGGSTARPARSGNGLGRLLVGLGIVLLALTPAFAALSQHRLRAAVAGLRSGDCRSAIDAALAAEAVPPARPESLEVLAYCDVRLGRADLAMLVMQRAVDREPENWEGWYGLALVRAAAGRDPRAAAARAYRLNPRGALPVDARRRFATDSATAWVSRAARARLPIKTIPE